ncbi:MAG: filamentous hemagglutinin N-terminal domain-containing protein, partial [Symploca sp. SIO2E6]|nr:filamentous hemagglutinin N-terminal domain-containing protein [Symploca sp. SIO2E6]
MGILRKKSIFTHYSLLITHYSLLVLSIFTATEAVAQVRSDNTLGGENSVVVPLDPNNQRIDGGAARGGNLFHSFREFNVGAGKGVYFANPLGIENILSRVTGNRPSRIFGRLGVLGDANLFLLNPQGIFFGENASLDINGSFLATTADAIGLGNQGYFSAAQPQTSSLLAVEPGALFFNQVANQPGMIKNQGNLVTGGDFTLWADNLDLQGQLQAGGDLNLLAQDRIMVLDNVADPFIAQAGEQLLVQGNQKVDILAFDHPDSGLFSGGDMILRSENRVEGNTRYTSGGNFTIEQLDGSLGELFSPQDPIVRAAGDVSFNRYTGASLHILAGGSVTIPGNIRITGIDANSIEEDVTLSNGTVVAVDGSTQPTVDIRAGTTALGAVGIAGGTATSANITIGSINNEGGLVLLTNQYFPDTTLTMGTIQVGVIDTSDRMGDGGNIYLDSRGSLGLTSDLKSSALRNGEAGDIRLLADENIAIASSRITSDAANGEAGLIEVQAGNSVEITTSTLTSESINANGAGAGGDINITAKTGSIALNQGRLNTSDTGNGFAGNITLNANNQIAITGNSQIRSNANNGLAGSIQLQANDAVNINNSQIQAESKGTNTAGSGGSIEIRTQAGSISANNSQIRSNANNGLAGSIQLQANDAVNINNSQIQAESKGTNTAGGGGLIEIRAQAGSISIDEGARLNTS